MTESMQETLEATFKEIQEREEEVPEKAEEVETKPDVKEPPAKEEEAEEKEGAPEPVVAKEEKKPEPVDEKLAHPPSTWTAKAKSQWSKIDPEIRQEIKRREASAAEGIRQYKEQAAYGDRISKTLNPYQPFFKSKNIDPIRVIEDAVNLAYTLDTSTPQQKGVILARIAKQYGADFSALAKPDPEQDRIQQVIAPLQSKIDQLERERLNSQSLVQQQQALETERMIQEFASKTDDTGQLLHPYFPNVSGVMTALLESGSAKTLDEAYAIAVEAHPETKLLVRAEQARQQEAKRQREEKERAAKAQKNDRINVQKRAPHSATTATPGSMRDTLEAAYSRLQNA
jgi:hypothetical protein